MREMCLAGYGKHLSGCAPAGIQAEILPFAKAEQRGSAISLAIERTVPLALDWLVIIFLGLPFLNYEINDLLNNFLYNKNILILPHRFFNHCTDFFP